MEMLLSVVEKEINLYLSQFYFIQMKNIVWPKWNNNLSKLIWISGILMKYHLIKVK